MSTNIDTNDESNYSLSSFHYKKLKINEILQKEGIITFFAIDTRTNSIVIEFNHTYHQPKTKKVIGPVDINNWSKFSDKVVKELVSSPIQIDRRVAILVKGNLDQEYDNIVDIVLANKNKNNNNNSLSGISDIYDNINNTKISNNENSLNDKQPQQQTEQEHKKDNYDGHGNTDILEPISVKETIRASEGPVLVSGRISGVSNTYKVITKIEWKCVSLDCQNQGFQTFYDLPLFTPPKMLDDTSGGNIPKCFKCGSEGFQIKYEFINAKTIQLDDIENIEEQYDRLRIILYGNAIDDIISGEIVDIKGNIKIQKKPDNNNVRSSKLINILHSSNIFSKNKEKIQITEKDIEIFYRWKKICIEAYKKEIGLVKKCKRCAQTIIPMTFEQRITKMFAPNVIGHNDKKMGILRTIIGGNKTSNIDNGRRGRINTLLVGDPGTAKSLLGKESTKINPNSKYVTASGVNGKSLIGIVEKDNDNSLSISYGVLVLAKNSHAVINEIGAMPFEDQKYFDELAEEGHCTLERYGRHFEIDAPTAILATANPIKTKWDSNHTISNSEIPVKQNLLHRFDQIYGFRDLESESELKEYADEKTRMKKRKPHNYNFLKKYLEYIKTIQQVKYTGYSERRLNAFFVKIKMKNVGTMRTFDSIQRIAETQAKLNMSWEVDDIIATKTMESLKLMYAQYGEIIDSISDPRDIVLEEFYDILKRNDGTSYTIYELCRIGSDNKKQVKEYLKGKWKLDTNRNLQNIIDMLEERPNIKIMSLKPKVLQYIVTSPPPPPPEQQQQSSSSSPSLKEEFAVPASVDSLSGISDIYDTPTNNYSQEKTKKYDDFENDVDSNLSYMSDRSDRDDEEEQTIKGFQMSAKGPIYKITEQQFKELNGEQQNQGEE
jgi:DNA replicative helicase MCM subunit Mcm2 (Cdc46/Mcm family)